MEDEDDEEEDEEEEEEEGEEGGGAGADADDPGGLQALLRRLGGGLEDLMPAAGHTHGRLKTILTGLRAAGDEVGGSLITSTRPTLNPLLLLLLSSCSSSLCSCSSTSSSSSSSVSQKVSHALTSVRVIVVDDPGGRGGRWRR